MNNIEIRQAIAKKRLKHYEVAKAYGVSQTYFSHLLQNELPPEKKREILKVIKDIKL